MNRKENYEKARLLITAFKSEAIRTDVVVASGAIQGWDDNSGLPLLGLGRRVTGVGGSEMDGSR